MGAHFQRALILFEQSRPELAEAELRQELADDPDSAVAHALLALCLADREQLREATHEAQQAIALSPDMPFAHYAHARVLCDRHHIPEALAAVEEAIRLDPEDADQFALLSGIRYAQRDWPASLSAAEQGLAVDPEHVGCTNRRAMALVKLGKKDQAGQTIEAALARDPEDAVSHATQGWTYLSKGQPEKALEHFRESLRLDPQSDFARSGIVEALKARHFIYRWMLSYFLFMSRLSRRVQWGIIIGAYLGVNVLRRVAAANPEWAPWIWPVLAAYIAFAVMTWLAQPLFNLLLRLNRFGRLALSRDQVVASNWVGCGMLLAISALCAWAFTGVTGWLVAALMSALLVMPLAGTFACDPGWPRRAMAAYTALVAMVGLTAAGTLVVIGTIPDEILRKAAVGDGSTLGTVLPFLELAAGAIGPCSMLFFVGIIAAGFVANALAGATARR